MRIPSESLEPNLAALFAGRTALKGRIQRITGETVVLRLAREVVELPLALFSAPVREALREGIAVELQRDQGTVQLRVVPAEPVSPQEQPSFSPQTLAEALLALDLRPTEPLQLAAQMLLERGFPLQKEYLLLLLPWAEQGRLEEALLLLEARLPVTADLVELVGEVKEGFPLSRVVEQGAPEFSPELQEALRYPSLRSREAWGARPGEGRVWRAWARLVAYEHLLNSLLTAQQEGNSGFMLFLPFMLGQDLAAAWVRVSQEQEGEEHQGLQPHKLELLLPTQSFGLLRAELVVWGQALRLNLWAEQNLPLLEGELAELTAELGAAGWQVQGVKAGELEQCARQSLYAMIGK